jgi:ATP-dependent Clp protease ATP-binding subunit ClpC
MFERFTDRARYSVVLAQEEARRLNHDYIGTEHLLLGLLGEADGVGARVLRQLGIGLEAVRADVEGLIGRGVTPSAAGHIPFTPRSKKVLELSLREALQLGHNYIGTEHILLGLVREGEGVAAQVLVNRGAALERVRKAVLDQLGQLSSGGAPARGRERPRLTPAAEQALAAAEQLAGSSPMGSHHLLEALVRSEDSLAGKVLAAVGADAESVAAKIDELGVEGTTDLTPEEAAARQVRVRIEDDEVRVVLRDEGTIGLVRAISGHVGGDLRGDDPALGSLVGLRESILHSLEELERRVAPPPPEPEPERESKATIVQRAIQSRLRRRGGSGSVT